MPKNASTCEPTTIEPSSKRMLFTPTARASAGRSDAATPRVRRTNSGALLTGSTIGNSPA